MRLRDLAKNRCPRGVPAPYCPLRARTARVTAATTTILLGLLLLVSNWLTVEEQPLNSKPITIP